MLKPARLIQALELLGQLLAERNESFELVVIGGGALLLTGLSSRATVDIDIVARRRVWHRVAGMTDG